MIFSLYLSPSFMRIICTKLRKLEVFGCPMLTWIIEYNNRNNNNKEQSQTQIKWREMYGDHSHILSIKLSLSRLQINFRRKQKLAPQKKLCKVSDVSISVLPSWSSSSSWRSCLNTCVKNPPFLCRNESWHVPLTAREEPKPHANVSSLVSVCSCLHHGERHFLSLSS